MTDRELLEMAAKAAGITIERSRLDDQLFLNLLTSDFVGWNPLTDDGDALRLAVKLRMDIHIDIDDSYAIALGSCIGGGFTEKDIDPNAATRRAIVRAAAEIGKAMP